MKEILQTSIKKAQDARAEKCLNVSVNIGGLIKTRSEWLAKWKADGATAQKAEKSRVEYNRRKFNSMSGAEQQEYEKKMAEKVPSYRIYTDESSFYEVTKIEYDYFLTL